MPLKIGIPRALLFYEYAPLIITFFEELGAEVILSDKTNKNIMHQGTNNSVDEACIPIKLFHGHVLDLKDKVDYILIPRIKSLHKGEHICPKFSGLPEMIRFSIKDLPKIINADFDFIKSQDNLKQTIYDMGKLFSDDETFIWSCFKKAYMKYRHQKKTMLNINSGHKKILILGHPYNLYDTYLNMNTLEKVRNNGVDILTPDMIPDKLTNVYVKQFNTKLYWTFARKLVSTVLYSLDKTNISGIIYISTFGCGVDSVVENLIEKRVKTQSKIPFMILTLDEHSGDAGINTRIEAFIDMIKWRDKYESNISAHG
jgi:predicted nucleotide-binding protein (sugar kinase/HSP70/actin superfamily)